MATNTTAVSLLDCLTHNNLITNLYSTLANNRLSIFTFLYTGVLAAEALERLI